MTIDPTLLGKSIEAIRDEQRIQRAEVDALRSELQAQRGELQAQRAELKAMRIRLDLIDRSLAEVVTVTTATADAVTARTASIDTLRRNAPADGDRPGSGVAGDRASPMT